MASVIGAGTSNQDGWHLAWQGRYGYAYDESAFRHLLALERTRSARLGVPILLVLVELTSSLAPSPLHSGGLAHRLFSALSGCVRETDIVGWHRRHRAAGIVFTDLPDASATEVFRLLQTRIARALDRALPTMVAFDIQRRIHGYSRPSESMATAAVAGAEQTGTGRNRC
jgi:hypothetical protein